MAFLRRLLGFDSTPAKQAPAAAPVPANPFLSPSFAPAGGSDDFEAVSDRGAGPIALRWAVRVALGLVILAGLNQVLIQPLREQFSDPEPTKAAATPIDHDAAASVASSFAVDYLSWAGAPWAEWRAEAVMAWADPETVASANDLGVISGEAVLIADSPSVATVSTISSDRAVVAVRVRVTPYILPPGAQDKTPSTPPATAAKPGAFNPAPPPAPWARQQSVWLTLVVPVISRGGSVGVPAPGPVLGSSDGRHVDAPLDAETDSEALAQLTPSAQTIAEAYGSSELDYVAAPGSSITGLNAAVTVTRVSELRVLSPPDTAKAPATRTATMQITWTLAGTAVQLQQTYGLVIGDLRRAPLLIDIGAVSPPSP